ncbi:MAG: hypothetical protein RLZ55_987 [Actinomycetota bacterium]
MGDVVRLAPARGPVATGDDAAGVTDVECAAQPRRDGAGGASQVQRPRGGVDQQPSELGVAREPIRLPATERPLSESVAGGPCGGGPRGQRIAAVSAVREVLQGDDDSGPSAGAGGAREPRSGSGAGQIEQGIGASRGGGHISGGRVGAASGLHELGEDAGEFGADGAGQVAADGPRAADFGEVETASAVCVGRVMVCRAGVDLVGPGAQGAAQCPWVGVRRDGEEGILEVGIGGSAGGGGAGSRAQRVDASQGQPALGEGCGCLGVIAHPGSRAADPGRVGAVEQLGVLEPGDCGGRPRRQGAGSVDRADGGEVCRRHPGGQQVQTIRHVGQVCGQQSPVATGPVGPSDVGKDRRDRPVRIGKGVEHGSNRSPRRSAFAAE